ncbi:MAG: DUF4834 family protein [Cyclobacteriaceae bacterium]
MLKFLLIVLLVGFIFFRIIGFFLRLLMGSSADNRTRTQTFNRQQPGAKARPKSGNVNIDYIPGKINDKDNKKFSGGEYVDFEEVE